MTFRVLPRIVVAAVVAAVVLLVWPVQRHHMFAVAESADSIAATPVGDGEPVTPIQGVSGDSSPGWWA